MTSKIGFAVSAAIHSTVAFTAVAYFSAPQPPAVTEKRLTMNLAMFEKPMETPPAPEAKPVIPENKPAPLPAPVEPQPAPEPAAEEVNPFSEEEPAPVEETVTAPPAESHMEHHAHGQPDQKINYISQVAAAVEKNKFYPMAARKRGLAGEARITMNINEDGTLSDLTVECNHPILQKAAEEAVRKSCPLPKPGDSTQCPMCLVFKMKFELN